MSTHDTPWPAGTPSWVDCSFSDFHRARTFYAHLFGWRIDEGPAELGHYSVALKNHHAAAGLVPKMQPETPTAWCTYFATDDAAASVQAVRAAGGSVIVEPMEVPDTGVMAICTDAEGAFFGLWQAGRHTGFGIANEPGAVCWNDLMTRDVDTAKAFYSAVFGYTFDESRPEYVVCLRTSDAAPVAGIHHATEMPDDVPANWLTHFTVADREAAIGTIEELDGTVLMTFDTPMGPEAIVQGLEGETFAVMAPFTDAA